MPATHLKNPPIVLTAVGTIVAALVSSLIGVYAPVFLLNDNQVLYLFSTSAQVVGGVFGLTIAGYTFLRNELDRQKKEDESLAEQIDELKARYFYLATFITAVSALAIFTSLLTISVGTPHRANENVIAINASQSVVVAAVLSIAYFILDIFRPGRIERISDGIRKDLDRESTSDKGSLEEFLRSFNQIEQLLDAYQNDYLQNRQQARYRTSIARIPKPKIVEFIFRSELIDGDIRTRLVDLIRLRNSLIHGTELYVSKHTVTEAATLLEVLRTALMNRNSVAAEPTATIPTSE